MPRLDLDALFAEAPKKAGPKKAKGRISSILRGVDLFAGVGGLTMAAVASGCHILGVERNPVAAETGRRAGHPMVTGDASSVHLYDDMLFGVDLLVGGPPCQPFSSQGSGKGEYDSRDGFPIVLGAIDQLTPRRVVFENVPAFLQKKHAAYAKKVLSDLGKRFAYAGVWQLNAKDFGVPQDRKRVFLWAAEVPLQPPTPTHGPAAGRPYVSVRQALPHLALEAPAIHVRSETAVSRSIDEPSPTVATKGTIYTERKAGLVYGKDPHQGRRLTPDELKVLQGFPSSFMFTGNLGEQHKQVGNAVPPPMGKAVIEAVMYGLVTPRLTPQGVIERLRQENPEARLLEPRGAFDAGLVGVTNAVPWSRGKLVAAYSRDALIDASIAHLLEIEPTRDPEDVWDDSAQWVDQLGLTGSEHDPVVILLPEEDPIDWEEE
jgi:DNA (cytosine-5)-methyltransferase 1